MLLLGARRGLARIKPGPPQRLDVAGAVALWAALLTFVVPLTFGRDDGWPTWVWSCFAACALVVGAFVNHERRIRARGGHPLFDIALLRLPGVAAGVAAVFSR